MFFFFFLKLVLNCYKHLRQILWLKMNWQKLAFQSSTGRLGHMWSYQKNDCGNCDQRIGLPGDQTSKGHCCNA